MPSELFVNPYRPSAGHMPPHLAGRHAEQDDFKRILRQSVVTENLILTGLRGVGKTVLLGHMKPIALQAGWLWTGEDLTEQSSLSEEKIATRIITDLSAILSPLFVQTQIEMPMGFTGKPNAVQTPVGYNDLEKIFSATPGLTSDKLKAVLRAVGQLISSTKIKGIVFAYDEAQNMADHASKDQFPLSLLLDVFQSVQRSPGGLPFMLVLTGLPTLFPKLIEARTYSERMFHTIFLDRLSEADSTEAINVPITHNKSSVHFDEKTVKQIVRMAGGYPYFIQFICREAFDICVSKLVAKQEPIVSPELILKKLDSDFFSARWDKVSDAQRNFLKVVAQIPNCEDEFSVSEVVAISRSLLDKPYSSSSVTQFLGRLSDHGLIYRGSNGKYRFAVPLLSRFIRRQMTEEANLPPAFRESNG
jgi:AAA ATPase domain